MSGDGRGADVEGDAQHQVAKTGPDGEHLPLMTNRDGHLPLSLAKKREIGPFRRIPSPPPPPTIGQRPDRGGVGSVRGHHRASTIGFGYFEVVEAITGSA